VEGYTVIARRWRPKRFEELVGQGSIVRALSNAVAAKRIAHAYLFVGPRGTGKTSTARLFAMALNCENGPRLDYDPNSPRCQAIFQGRSMDVIEIDGASNNSVDQIRALREECQYAPAEGLYKIYIIDEVHMLTTAAFNALLKTLEEPPSHVKFIFATTEIHKVPNTIVSRCQHFQFFPLETEIIEKHLRHIVDTEKVQAEDMALHVIAQLAEGGMRDAQSMLDQLLTFSEGNLTAAAVQSMYGLLEEAEVQNLTGAIENGNYAGILKSIDRIVETGCDAYRVLRDLERCFRQKFLDAVKAPEKSTYVPLVYAKILEILQSGEEQLQRGLSVRSNLEAILFRAVECTKLASIETLLQAFNNLPEDVKKKRLLTVLENVERLLRGSRGRLEVLGNSSVEVHEKNKEDPSECFPIKVPAKPTETISDKYKQSTSEDAGILNFQPEPHAPFEQEPTYDVDAFQKNDRTVEKLLTPPPDFKKALTQIPQPLKEAFKEILNGELVGVWPIGSDCLRK